MTARHPLTLLALIPALFLIVLGMRNPYLEHSHGPKQRPRAVVEQKLSKSPVVNSCSIEQFAAVVSVVLALICKAAASVGFAAPVIRELPAPDLRSRHSRAPPFALTSF
ncbi:MAG TPA: hypothetical protein VJ550_11210 [Geomonas sp.]|nr:hypothetical protein [Geomonas sp.]